MQSPHDLVTSALRTVRQRPSTPGRHCRPQPFRGRHRHHPPARTVAARRGTALALVLTVLLAGASMADRGRVAPAPPEAAVAAYLQERAEVAHPGSRSALRAAESATTPPPPVALAATPEASPTPAPPMPSLPQSRAEPRAQQPGPQRVAPVGGLTQVQMDHAATIVAMGQRAGLPEYAYVIAIATALQESYLRNLANPTVPESLRYPNDGTGRDHDSVGLFQQRPSTGWGTVAQIMDPSYSATKFYDSLQRVSGWQHMAVTVAAQRVQRSAFPNAYAKHEPLARQIVDALT